ncbi:MAG: hypothetical protein V1809_11760 [Planctomycetota bacterium]
MKDISAMQDRAATMLERWAVAAEEHWRRVDNDASMGCYGPGYLTWGVQSNWNYAGVMATLAVRAATTDKAKWRDRAVSALRFALATHVTGGRPGNDGKPWGNSWISVLGIERAMHGLAGIESALSAADRDALRRVLVNEADWLLLRATRGKFAGVAAGLWNSDGCNNPESNVWSGCFLWRVAERYPGESRAADWKEQAHRFLMNGISVEADAHDSTRVAGRPVSDRHVGANFFPHYALDHHGYLNVGYMAICSSHAAILHFDLKRAGGNPPASLYHHQADLWQVLRRMIFSDGRLARIGGDSRVRYAYCQEYLLPALLFAADHLRDPHALPLAEHQLGLIEQEAAVSGDGTFYGRRLDHLRRHNPHYYTRLESDRACVLAMLLNYLPLVRVPASPAVSFEESVAGGWLEEAHGAVMHRSASRLSSFAWRAHGLTQALCLPPRDSSLAEWSANLCPVVRFLGDDGSRPGEHRRLLAHHVRSFDGGFVTCGAVMEGVNVTIDEGASCTDQAVTHIAFAALPDGRTCLCLQYVVAAADRVAYFAEIKDLHVAVPNDLFNGFRRTVWSSAGKTVLASPPERSEALEFHGGWLNIDDCLGVVALYGGNGLLIDRSASRRGGRYPSIFVEEVCLHIQNRVTRCRSGEVLADIGFALLSGATAESTARVRGGAIPFSQKGLRGVWVDGANGSRYALVANFGAAAQTVDVFGEPIELAGGAAAVQSLITATPNPSNAGDA